MDWKSISKKINKAVSIGVMAAVVGVGAQAIKNVYQIEDNSRINIEQGITSSDIKQMNELDSYISNFDSSGQLLKDLTGVEGQCIYLNFHSYAMTNMALSDDISLEDKKRAVKSIESAIEEYLSDDIRNDMLGYNEAKKLSGLEFKLTPNAKDSFFYYGGLNLMINGYELASKDKKFSKLSEGLTKEISEKIIESGGSSLNSFGGGESWNADMPVALASLHIYDKINGTDYSSKPIELWKNWVKENMLDSDGDLYTTMENDTKRPIKEAKGSNFAYSIIFTSFFDKEFSSELYDSFRKSFYTNIGGVDLVKEWKDGSNTVDEDSGPVIMGAGTVASAFGMGAAKVNGDYGHFSSLSLAAELATLPIETFSEKSYLANISLGEVALLFNRTLRDW